MRLPTLSIQSLSLIPSVKRDPVHRKVSIQREKGKRKKQKRVLSLDLLSLFFSHRLVQNDPLSIPLRTNFPAKKQRKYGLPFSKEFSFRVVPFAVVALELFSICHSPSAISIPITTFKKQRSKGEHPPSHPNLLHTQQHFTSPSFAKAP